MVNKSQLSKKLKDTPRMTTRSRNKTGSKWYTINTKSRQDEKALLETIQKIVKDELAFNQPAIKEMINDNIKVTNGHSDKILPDLTDLKKSLEFTQDQMKDGINKIMKDIKELDKSINEVQQDLLKPNCLSSKLIELEDGSRKNNLRINEIDEKQNKTWDWCEPHLQELIEVKLGIPDAMEFERCHRIPAQTNSSKNQICPWTIICIKWQNLKINKRSWNMSNLWKIYEDFYKDTWIYEREYGPKY